MIKTAKKAASFATVKCVAIAASMFSEIVYAQDNSSWQGGGQPSTHASTRASKRRADHKLEHRVHAELNQAKVETIDILARAEGGKVYLIGDVPDSKMIALAGTAAGQVAGITAVDNRLILRPEEN
jgi:osmotically-inducible protein OsmY